MKSLIFTDIYVEALSKTRNSLVIKTLRDGEYFGDYSFVTGMARTASAKVRDFSILYTLSQHEFINALKEFP
jgi:CRP-like cAMP-binding protein